VLDWFKRWIGYPARAEGGERMALACARETLVGASSNRAVLYASDQTHSSLLRAARRLGLRTVQIRSLPTDGRRHAQPAQGGGPANLVPVPGSSLRI
jgi:hypothetical protein